MTSCIIEDTELIVAAARGARLLDWRAGDSLEQVIDAPRLFVVRDALDQAMVDAKHVRCELPVPVQRGQLRGGISVADHLFEAVGGHGEIHPGASQVDLVDRRAERGLVVAPTARQAAHVGVEHPDLQGGDVPRLAGTERARQHLRHQPCAGFLEAPLRAVDQPAGRRQCSGDQRRLVDSYERAGAQRQHVHGVGYREERGGAMIDEFVVDRSGPRLR